MPARREMLTGRGQLPGDAVEPVQPWDECLPAMLREQRGVYSHMITDHYHYFHSGGEGYNTIYSSWDGAHPADRVRTGRRLASTTWGPVGELDNVPGEWAGSGKRLSCHRFHMSER